MVLRFNEVREMYRGFRGKKTVKMHQLITDERVPISTAQSMERRLELINADENIKSTYFDNSIETGDAVVYHPDGRIKVVLDSQHLIELRSKSILNAGALVLTEDDYNSLDGEEFKKEKLKNLNRWLTNKETKDHPIWKILARDQSLLNDYTDYIFEVVKERLNYDEAMGIFLTCANGDSPEMRMWRLCELASRSSVSGVSDLDSQGILIGIAKEAFVFRDRISYRTMKPYIKQYTAADLKAFDNAKAQLEKILNPSVLKPISDLREKL